jgi:thiamine-phosphate pyrophosphorylase
MIDFRLIAITDSRLTDNLLNRIELLCSIGVPAIQLREKHLPANEILKISKKIKEISSRYHHSKLIINDRLDIALLSEADGIHSPEYGFTGKQLKDINIIKGKSIHSLDTAIKAEKEGFDYIIAGPVFHTPSKIQYGKPLGLEKLKEITSKVSIPVFAIGGVNINNAKKCIENGAYGIAGIREFMQKNEIYKVMYHYKKLLNIKLYLYL